MSTFVLLSKCKYMTIKGKKQAFNQFKQSDSLLTLAYNMETMEESDPEFHK